MRRMFAIERTIFAKLNALRLFLFIFGAVVIDALTNRTLKVDNFSHRINDSIPKPSTGLEPVTSSLPRTCSTN